MAQITWRNVDAPNQSVALQGIRQFGDMFGSATKGFGDATATFDNDTRVAAASPAISAYFQAAATGDPRAAQAALTQNAQGFGNLTPDQLGKVFSTGGTLTGAGIGNQAKRFDFDAAMRNDADQQNAVAAFTQLRPGIGTSQDTGPAFNSDAYKALSPVARQHFQRLMTDSGVASPYALADASAPTGASGALAKASTGDAGSSTWARMLTRESGNRQHNADGTVVRSPKGATGKAQIMPGTGPLAAKLAGVPWDPKAFEDDANYNERLGKAYFDKQLQDFGGDESKAAAAYNMGPGSVANKNGVNGLIAKYGDDWLSHAPKETRDYVANTVSNELARGMNQEGKRAALQTPAQIKAFGDAARVDSAMAKSLANLTGLSNIMGAAGDLTNPSDIASALVTKWDKVPHSAMLGEVNRIAEEYEITPAQAGEILLNKGMTANKGSGFLGARWLKDYVSGDPLLGTGYKVNEDQVSTIAKAIKSTAGQQLVAANYTRDAVAAALQPTQEAYDKSVNVYKELARRVDSNPALAPSLARAEANMLRLQSAAQNAVLRQNENPNFGQQFPTPVQVPAPVATTTGKVSGAAKVDEMIVEKPAVKPLFNPDAQQTPGSQQARLVAHRQRKADEAAKEAAGRAKEVDDLIAEGRARDAALEARRNRPRVNLAPANR
jgi:soluble lytic murein transglycosylase-like protein